MENNFEKQIEAQKKIEILQRKKEDEILDGFFMDEASADSQADRDEEAKLEE